MTAPALALAADLVQGLRRLKLARIRAIAPELCQTAKTQRWVPDEFLRTLIEAEIAARDEHHVGTLGGQAARDLQTYTATGASHHGCAGGTVGDVSRGPGSRHLCRYCAAAGAFASRIDLILSTLRCITGAMRRRIRGNTRLRMP
jgi:hypothetical protein